MKRREGPVRRLVGDRGSPQRRRLRALPVAGPVLILAVNSYRRVRDLWLTGQLKLQNAYTDFKNRRAETAANISRRNNRRAYERIYGDDRLLDDYLAPGRITFYAEVAELCAREHPRTVIDVGCGAGNLLQALLERVEPDRVVGIDYAGAGIRRASELVPAGEFHAMSLYDFDPDESFELVLCTEVLEHLSQPDSAMQLLVRLCAVAGVIVVTVPDGAVDDWAGHRNFWSEADLLEFLGAYGEVEVSRMRSNPLSLVARIWPGTRTAGVG
jgi:2-polyprenyl-3-methyl-5-hydroxy-6-metoxy-1,4-benzoquinol methylase